MDHAPPTITGRSASIRVPNWLAGILALIVIAAGVVVGLLVFLPIAIVSIGVFLVLLAAAWFRAQLARVRAPNGPLDGRHNVRVVTHTDGTRDRSGRDV